MLLPKLAAFDVDGTLIAFDGSCSDRTRTALSTLRDAGVVVALATGRPVAALAETIDRVGPVDFAVCGNGGATVDVATGDTVHSLTVPGVDVDRTVTGVRESLPGVGTAIDVGDQTIEEAGFGRRLPPRLAASPVSDALAAAGDPTPDAHRLVFFHDDYDDDLVTLADIVGGHIGGGSDVYYGNFLPIIEVIPSGLNKSVGLQALVSHLGFDAADTMVFGDADNDVGMFEWAGTAVAMGNAMPGLAPLADVQIETVDDDGVAKHVERLLGGAHV